MCKKCELSLSAKKYKEDYRYRDIKKIRLGVRDVYVSLFRNKKRIEERDWLGCTIDFFKKHIESQFQPGMCWENYGKWEFDHIVPISDFNLDQPYEKKICQNWFNIQPMWSLENKKKFKHTVSI